MDRDGALRGDAMRGADMRGADMRGADMRGADMRGADMRGGGGGAALFCGLFCATAPEGKAANTMRADARTDPSLNMTLLPYAPPHQRATAL